MKRVGITGATRKSKTCSRDVHRKKKGICIGEKVKKQTKTKDKKKATCSTTESEVSPTHIQITRKSKQSSQLVLIRYS